MAPHLNQDQIRSGYWSQSATIDWCESNYVLSHYIAEFWNTISNLAFIIPQLVQYIALSKYKCVEPAFRTAYLGLVLVGIGSLCFHLTLSRTMQMFDETSMILVALQGFYLLCIIRFPKINKKFLAFSLIFYGLAFLGLYIFLVEWPIFHHTAFGLVVYGGVIISFHLKRVHGQNYEFWTVVAIQHLGFAFWLFDKHYCDMLIQFREHHVPGLLRPLFQFHALWHLLMGLGSHIFICGLIKFRAWTSYKENFVMRYKYFGLLVTLELQQLNGSQENLHLTESDSTKPSSNDYDDNDNVNNRDGLDDGQPSINKGNSLKLRRPRFSGHIAMSGTSCISLVC